MLTVQPTEIVLPALTGRRRGKCSYCQIGIGPQCRGQIDKDNIVVFGIVLGIQLDRGAGVVDTHIDANCAGTTSAIRQLVGQRVGPALSGRDRTVTDLTRIIGINTLRSSSPVEKL